MRLKASMHPGWAVLDLYSLLSERELAKMDIKKIIARLEAEPGTAPETVLHLCEKLCSDTTTRNNLATYLCRSEVAMQLLLEGIQQKGAATRGKGGIFAPLPGLIWAEARLYCGPSALILDADLPENRLVSLNASHADFLHGEDAAWHRTQRSFRMLESISNLLQYTNNPSPGKFLDDHANTGFFDMLIWLLDEGKRHFSAEQADACHTLIMFWATTASKQLTLANFAHGNQTYFDFVRCVAGKLLRIIEEKGQAGFKAEDFAAGKLVSRFCSLVQNINATVRTLLR